MYRWKLIDKFLLGIGFNFQDELTSAGSDTSILIYGVFDKRTSIRIKIRMYVNKSEMVSSFFMEQNGEVQSPSGNKAITLLISKHPNIYRKVKLENILSDG